MLKLAYQLGLYIVVLVRLRSCRGPNNTNGYTHQQLWESLYASICLITIKHFNLTNHTILHHTCTSYKEWNICHLHSLRESYVWHMESFLESMLCHLRCQLGMDLVKCRFGLVSIRFLGLETKPNLLCLHRKDKTEPNHLITNLNQTI